MLLGEGIGSRHGGGCPHGLDWGRTLRAVRINGLDTQWCHDDVVEVVSGAREALDVIIVPKVRSARDVWWVDVLLTQLESSWGCSDRLPSKLSSRRPKGW